MTQTQEEPINDGGILRCPTCLNKLQKRKVGLVCKNWKCKNYWKMGNGVVFKEFAGKLIEKDISIEDIPVVICEEYNGQWRFWCPFCKKWHYHGAVAGHRGAHCGTAIGRPESPFSKTGYFIRLKKPSEYRNRKNKGKRKEELQNIMAKIGHAVEKDDSYKLDIFASVPPTLKPCGFYGDVLTEATWLPYKNDEHNVVLRPSIIMAKKDMPQPKPYKIVDFKDSDYNIKGTFPSQELPTLMSVHAVQMLEHIGNVEPAEVDKKIEEAFNKHLNMPRAEMLICKRWIEGSFFYDLFDAFPIQSVLGVSESGKSRLCMLNLALVYHGEGLVDPTEASIFRSKEEDRVSLIVDEAEYLNNPNLFSTLRILLNASYSRNSGYVTRYDEEDGRRIKRRFDLYSPLCISGIAGLEGVTLSRAFRIVMRRTNRDFPKAYSTDYNTLRDFLYVLRIRHCFEIYDIYKKLDISNIVTARFEELFKPLFAMTKFFGNQEEWEIIAEWCREYQNNFRMEALNVALEEMVLVTLSKLPASQPDWYELKSLTDTISGTHNVKMSSKTVSNVLYRLGLMKRKKVHGLTLIYASKELLETCASCIGLDVSSQISATIATTSTNSTTQPVESVSLNPTWLNTAEEEKT